MCNSEPAVDERVESMHLREKLTVLPLEPQLVSSEQLCFFSCDCELFPKLACHALGILCALLPLLLVSQCHAELSRDMLALG